MANSESLDLASQDNGLIKSTPMEETIKRISNMKTAYIRNLETKRINLKTIRALEYIIGYLKSQYCLSDLQIQDLSSEDLNRVPEMIFAVTGRTVLLFGLIPVFGWFFAGRYFAFKSRIKFLRSLVDGDIFNKENVESAIKQLYISHMHPY